MYQVVPPGVGVPSRARARARSFALVLGQCFPKCTANGPDPFAAPFLRHSPPPRPPATRKREPPDRIVEHVVVGVLPEPRVNKEMATQLPERNLNCQDSRFNSMEFNSRFLISRCAEKSVGELPKTEINGGTETTRTACSPPAKDVARAFYSRKSDAVGIVDS